jgi:hypothetical protein
MRASTAWPCNGTRSCVSGSFSPAGNPELPFDQIEPGDRFRDRMLDLKPRVHLHEPRATGPQTVRAVRDELDRCPRRHNQPPARPYGGLAHRGAQFRAHARRWRLLDHLLVATLQRAVALVEMDGVAVGVGKHLQLDMARRGNIFLDQHAGVAERTLGLSLRGLKRRVEIRVLVDAAHALAAAAGNGLDQHRIADLVGLLFEERRFWRSP